MRTCVAALLPLVRVLDAAALQQLTAHDPWRTHASSVSHQTMPRYEPNRGSIVGKMISMDSISMSSAKPPPPPAELEGKQEDDFL